MAKFRKKPVVVDAVQWHGQAMRGVCMLNCRQDYPPGTPHVHTIHLGQTVALEPGDWILPEADGEHFYPVKPADFARIYEPIAEYAPPLPADSVGPIISEEMDLDKQIDVLSRHCDHVQSALSELRQRRKAEQAD